MPAASLVAALALALGIIGLIALASSADTSALSVDASAGSSGAPDLSGLNDGSLNLDGFGSETLTVERDGEALEIESLGDGNYRITGSDGTEFYIVADAEGFIPDPNGNYLVPDPNGSVGGFRLGEDGSISLVPPGELGDDVIRFFLRADGALELLEPGQRSGDGIVVDPDGFGNWGFNGGGGFDGLGNIPGGSSGRVPPIAGAPDTPFNGSASAAEDGADTPEEADSGGSIGSILIWVAVGLAAVAAVILASLWWKSREVEPTPTDDIVSPHPHQRTIESLDQLIAKIEAEPDPRLAVRQAYALIETGLGSNELRRAATETPNDYLRRVFGEIGGAARPLEELTMLFELARFSDRAIDEDMRARALDSLHAVRREYETLGAHPIPA